MLLFAVLIAGSFSFGGIAATRMPGFAINLVRYAIATGAMLGVGLLVLRSQVRFPAAPWRFVLLGALMAIYMSTMFKALEFTSPVATGAVFTLMPLISAGFAWLFMRQVTRPGVMLSLFIAAAGAIWVIFRGDIAAIVAFDVGAGEIIFFVGVVCHAAYAPLLRKLNRGESSFEFAFWGVAATLLWLAIPGVPTLNRVDLAGVPTVVWLAILYLAIVTTVITFLLIQYASLRLPAPKVLGYGYLTPSFIIVLEGVIGHGWVPASVAAGALVTACGLLVMALLPD
ncbi:MAG: DMT family transporter [Rhizobium sp.]|nr:DMT family transporter [Rhizobium sp.]